MTTETDDDHELQRQLVTHLTFDRLNVPQFLAVRRSTISDNSALHRTVNEVNSTNNDENDDEMNAKSRKRSDTGIPAAYSQDSLSRPSSRTTTSTVTTTTIPNTPTRFLNVPSRNQEFSITTRLQSRSNLALADTLMKCDLIGPTVAGLPDEPDESTDDDVGERAEKTSKLDVERNNALATRNVEAASVNDDTPIDQKKFACSRLIGISCVIACGLAVTVGSVLTKTLLAQGVTTHQLNTIRQAGIFFPTLIYLLWRRTENPLKLSLIRQYYFPLLLRCLSGVVAPICFMYALTRLPVGDTTALAYSTPIFMGILTRIFLGERYKLIYFPVTIVIGVGCILIARPAALFGSSASTTTTNTTDVNARLWPNASDRLIGCVLATSCALTTSVAIICVRKMRKMSPSVLMFNTTSIGFLLCLVIQTLDSSTTDSFSASMANIWSSWIALVYIFGYMFSQAFSQIMFGISLQYEDANIISLVRTTDIMWAFLAQVLVFNAVPHMLSITGALLIVVSVLILGLWKVMLAKENQHLAADKSRKAEKGKIVQWYLTKQNSIIRNQK